MQTGMIGFMAELILKGKKMQTQLHEVMEASK